MTQDKEVKSFKVVGRSLGTYKILLHPDDGLRLNGTLIGLRMLEMFSNGKSAREFAATCFPNAKEIEFFERWSK